MYNISGDGSCFLSCYTAHQFFSQESDQLSNKLNHRMTANFNAFKEMIIFPTEIRYGNSEILNKKEDWISYYISTKATKTWRDNLDIAEFAVIEQTIVTIITSNNSSKRSVHTIFDDPRAVTDLKVIYLNNNHYNLNIHKDLPIQQFRRSKNNISWSYMHRNRSYNRKRKRNHWTQTRNIQRMVWLYHHTK